ncbi:hypothetical protein K491DRAFT_500517 [Lophiostoma macrostomum CBS 122681]|uniref:Peroxin 11C n=1 Tax=Lophiostoma macrostomum CBS 122681 TaxID=1314788 RepID=A0A6A6T3T9_9PLEO|nr:hypothetical protein K491DRAFT_500517 [Lophiostoma macrostomum CBS 122681]
MASADHHPTAITTIPSDTAVPTPAPARDNDAFSSSSPPSKPPSSRIHTLRRLLHAHITQTTDRTLTRLSKLLSNPASTDALICTLGYIFTLLSSLTSRTLSRRLTTLATSIATKAQDVLLPGETLVATIPAPTSTRVLAQASTSCKALGDVLLDFHIFVRLWGVVGIWAWAREVWGTPLPAKSDNGSKNGDEVKKIWKEKVLRRIAWAQIASCTTFQIIENVAYLASKGVLDGLPGWTGEEGKRREVKWWAWSSRFWAAHVVLEFGRLWTIWRYQDQDAGGGHAHGVSDGEKEDKLKMVEKKREDRIWWRDVVSNVAYFPLTMHWSHEEGLLGDGRVGACGMVAGGVLLVDAWRETA